MAKIASKVLLEDGVRFEFIDGEYLHCELDDLSNDMIRKLARHGLSQKGGDSYAGAESVGEARLMAEGIWNNLKMGVWAVKAARGGKIVEALHRATKQPLDVCLAKWAAMDDAAKAGLKKHPDVKRAIAEIDAERAAALADAAGEADTSLADLF